MKITNLIKRTDTMARKKIFGNSIIPKCEYCQFGSRTKEGSKILCIKQGLVDSNFSCGKFIYSPFKRIPKKQLANEEIEDDSI
ncbi:MAG: hypothetical protein WC900_01430 [Oscillospiraceae bacterium]|jgi:hypothetical protein